MQTRIKKETTVEGKVRFTPQWRKSWYSEWKGFNIYTNIATNNDYEIVSSSPCKYLSNSVLRLEMAQQVIDNFLKNPVTEDKVEYIKYP